MSDAEWDAEDFEPQAATGAQPTDKWEGEDSDDEVKDNWDDEDDEGTDSNKESGSGTSAVAKKKPLKVRIAEKEAKRKAEKEARLKAEEEAKAAMTPEQLAEEKARQLKLQEDADLELAKDAFGVGDNEETKGVIDAFDPITKDDFNKFAELLKTKITKSEKSPHYSSFLDALVRDLATGLEAEELKKLGSTLNAVANEKTKLQKAGKGKKKKTAAKLNAGRDNNYEDYQANDYDEYDDFI